MEIDFVVTWVNMDDPEWKAKFEKYSGKTVAHKNGVSDARFRDFGLLRYWFRGIEKFAPWVRKIHFLTSGELPDWLDVNNPKINVVVHDEFIPSQFLPTFNSVVIERYMHLISGLAEHFVYFNDDFYIIRPIAPSRFFQDGLPCDIAVMQYNPTWSQYYKTLKNNIDIINRHFNKKEVMRKFHDKWFDKSYGSKACMNRLLQPYNKFLTLRTPHNAQPYLKHTFLEVWDAAGKELTETSSNRFRALNDLTPELFRTWQICSGNFTPYNTYQDTKMFPLLIKSKKAMEAIRNQSYSLICINDNQHIREYDKVMTGIQSAFDSILPDKSSFEL